MAKQKGWCGHRRRVSTCGSPARRWVQQKGKMSILTASGTQSGRSHTRASMETSRAPPPPLRSKTGSVFQIHRRPPRPSTPRSSARPDSTALGRSLCSTKTKKRKALRCRCHHLPAPGTGLTAYNTRQKTGRARNTKAEETKGPLALKFAFPFVSDCKSSATAKNRSRRNVVGGGSPRPESAASCSRGRQRDRAVSPRRGGFGIRALSRQGGGSKR